MKLIIAYLQPEKLPAVKAELQRPKLVDSQQQTHLAAVLSLVTKRLIEEQRRNQLAQKDSS